MPDVANSRRIPKLDPAGLSLDQSAFFFHRARRILFRQDEKEWGVHPPVPGRGHLFEKKNTAAGRRRPLRPAFVVKGLLI